MRDTTGVEKGNLHVLTVIWLSLIIGFVLLGHDLREIRKSLRNIERNSGTKVA